MSSFLASAGTKFLYGVVGSPPTTQLSGIRKYAGLPDLDADEFETTELDQEDPDVPGEIDWFKQIELGFIDPGNIALTLSFKDANISTVYSLHRVKQAFRIAFKSGATFDCTGAIKKIGKQVQEKADILIDVQIRLSGKVKWTPAS